MILVCQSFQHFMDPISHEVHPPLHSLHLQNFYNQCFQDDTLVMIKDSTPVDRKQLDPNKVGSALDLPHRRTEGTELFKNQSIYVVRPCILKKALFFWFFEGFKLFLLRFNVNGLRECERKKCLVIFYTKH